MGKESISRIRDIYSEGDKKFTLKELRKTFAVARKKTTPEKYAKFLESLLLLFAELRMKEKDSLVNTFELSATLQGVANDLLQEVAKQNENLQEQLAKHRGKKVSKERMRLYQEIEGENQKFMDQGAASNFAQAARIVSRRNRQHFKTLYSSFMEWKNKSKKPKCQL